MQKRHGDLGELLAAGRAIQFGCLVIVIGNGIQGCGIDDQVVAQVGEHDQQRQHGNGGLGVIEDGEAGNAAGFEDGSQQAQIGVQHKLPGQDQCHGAGNAGQIGQKFDGRVEFFAVGTQHIGHPHGQEHLQGNDDDRVAQHGDQAAPEGVIIEDLFVVVETEEHHTAQGVVGEGDHDTVDQGVSIEDTEHDQPGNQEDVAPFGLSGFQLAYFGFCCSFCHKP